MLGIYLFARFFAWVIGVALLVFAIVVYLAWLLVAAIGRALLSPDTWRPRQPRSPRRVPPAHPRNERMYYSNRR